MTLTRELAVPFRIDTLGRIAFETDPVRQITARLITLIGTQIRERLMLPTYGVDLLGYLFETNDDSAMVRLQTEIEAAVALWEPGVTIQAVEPKQDQVNGVLGVLVTFSVAGVEDDVTTYTAFVEAGASSG